jgi:FkbH-like protein
VVVEPIEPFLRHLGLRSGLNSELRFGDYDNVYQEAVGGSPGLLGERTDCVVVWLCLDVLSPDLSRRFACLDPPRIRDEASRIREHLVEILEGIRRQTAAMVVWPAFEVPTRPALGIADAGAPLGQVALVEELNGALRSLVGAARNAYFLDTNACRARIGEKAFYDRRYWHIGRAPYALEGLAEIARELFAHLRALKGRARKCLVLDCDDVLWGGVLGEEGPSGIRLGTTHPGSAHREFQQELLNLHARGVILALCSKNDAQDVWDVFRKHPDMLLGEEHIASARINWRDKAENLREIAAELEIGLDSLLFVDDSEFETELVKSLLPEVAVLCLPRGRAVEYRDLLLAGAWFDTLTISSEDRARGQSYRAEKQRRAARTGTRDLETYLASLEMRAEICLADSLSIPRIAQLSQKTNQFNLTTRRYTDEDIQQLSRSHSADVIGLRLRDRFGDSGLVGACVLRYAGEVATVESLLLSCRVLGRGLEDAFAVACLRHARRRGARVAIGEFAPTARNGIVTDFYPARGFRPAGESDGRQRFELDLGSWAGEVPRHFQAVDFDLEERESG